MTKACERILEHEYKDIRTRYEEACRRLQRLVQSPHYDVTELVCRLLTSRVLPQAAGSLLKYGYPNAVFYGPLHRMEWVVHFVGHEILDDGEPALCWHRYGWYEAEDRTTYQGQPGDTVPCKRDDEGAMPYWHRYWEIAPEDKEWLRADNALETLDWYEAHEERRYEVANQRHRAQGRAEETRKPENPLMVELAEELRALPKISKEEWR